MNGTVVSAAGVIAAMMGIAFTEELASLAWWVAFLPYRAYAAIRNAITKKH